VRGRDRIIIPTHIVYLYRSNPRYRDIKKHRINKTFGIEIDRYTAAGNCWRWW